MKFLKTYWYLLIIMTITLGVGVMALLTSQKLQQTQPVAPNVPQSTPQAAAPACTLTFSLGVSPTPTISGSPTPTVTMTTTPTVTGSLTPTVTGSLTPTPHSDNTLPDCTSLTVNPNSTEEAPLTVTLTCNGRDIDGDVTAAEFTFGDGTTQLIEKNVGSPGTLSTTHIYKNLGGFQPSCRIRDNNFTFSNVPDACKKAITIGNITPTPIGELSNAPTPKVPVAGAGPTVLGATAIGGGILLLLLGLLAF